LKVLCKILLKVFFFYDEDKKGQIMKTTLAGILYAIGTVLTIQQKPSWLPFAGQILQGIAVVFLGYNAQDSAKTKDKK
jgi:uncharacterized membrane protein